MNKRIAILGARGIPARHGGFETFAQHLALYLVSHGWDVTVYCQGDVGAASRAEDRWNGVRRVTFGVHVAGPAGTIEFDWRSIRDAAREKYPLTLTLGYNTAVFCTRLRLAGIVNIINMDGLEWKRQKWRAHERAWLWMNERIGCLVGNHLVADHPAIADHLSTRVSRRKITTIAYGADGVPVAGTDALDRYGLESGRYGIVIARPEAENSVLEIVTAFSKRHRQMKLMVLGYYDPAHHAYHARVKAAASDEVLFPGGIYDSEVVGALRAHARFYVHGHQVGGTNPSLVEALAASNAVIAHDNPFNRWVAGPSARYFASVDACDEWMTSLTTDDSLVEAMRLGSFARYRAEFQWERILGDYENLFVRFLSAPQIEHRQDESRMGADASPREWRG
ncbi:DUF1972 domain-containing protein [Burkholderia stagnalis]|uniref:DUF1972 domain-containing protein n=1 Tax=Burkholderia stagnalis TaxID=1503054 RepID=UPI0007C85169|nr:DUF1972 domain-containing protein [Burkholderia stagnalis]